MYNGNEIVTYIVDQVFTKYRNELLKYGPDYVPDFIIYVGPDYYSSIINSNISQNLLQSKEEVKIAGFSVKMVTEDSYLHIANRR